MYANVNTMYAKTYTLKIFAAKYEFWKFLFCFKDVF